MKWVAFDFASIQTNGVIIAVNGFCLVLNTALAILKYFEGDSDFYATASHIYM